MRHDFSFLLFKVYRQQSDYLKLVKVSKVKGKINLLIVPVPYSSTLNSKTFHKTTVNLRDEKESCKIPLNTLNKLFHFYYLDVSIKLWDDKQYLSCHLKKKKRKNTCLAVSVSTSIQNCNDVLPMLIRTGNNLGNICITGDNRSDNLKNPLLNFTIRKIFRFHIVEFM